MYGLNLIFYIILNLQQILDDNSDIFYAKVDISSSKFKKLEDAVGLYKAPAALLMVHGKGVWVSGTNASLFSERLSEFIDAYNDASSTHTDPY